MTGQDDGSVINTGTLDRLIINRAAEDDDGNQLSAGVYSTYDPSIESRVYSIKDKPIQFRPFINAYQYMEYDPDNNNYPCTSVIFKQWNEEAIDSSGGVNCGRIRGKDKENLTQAQIDAQRHIKCYRLVYGLVSMDATTPAGEPTKVEDLPVLFRVTGSNFIPIGESLNMIKAANFAVKKKLDLITLSGFSKNNSLKKKGKVNFWVDSKKYNIIENTHQIILLSLVDYFL